MRRPLALALFLAAALPPAGALAAARSAPVTVLVSAQVDPDARQAMPEAMWTRLVDAWVRADRVIRAEGEGLPSTERCRAAGALYAVAARFASAPRVLGGDPQRTPAVVRIDVRNCADGTTSQRILRVASEPAGRGSEGDYEPDAQVRWEEPVRAALDRAPLALTAVARVVRVDGTLVTITDPGDLHAGDVVRVFADAHLAAREPIDLIVIRADGRSATATWDPRAGGAPPRAGDFVKPRG